jgi:hypothetical protein
MDESGVQESWNMATETMKRLSNLLDLCTHYFHEKRFVELYDCLLNLRRNIIPFLEVKEIEEVNNLFDSLPTEKWISGEKKIIPQHFSKVYTIFDRIYIFYVIKMKKRGLLMPEVKDRSKAIIGM